MHELTERVIRDLLFVMDISGAIPHDTVKLEGGASDRVRGRGTRLIFTFNESRLQTTSPGQLWLRVRSLVHKVTHVEPWRAAAAHENYDLQFVWDFLVALDRRALHGFLFDLLKHNKRLDLSVTIRRTVSESHGETNAYATYEPEQRTFVLALNRERCVADGTWFPVPVAMMVADLYVEMMHDFLDYADPELRKRIPHTEPDWRTVCVPTLTSPKTHERTSPSALRRP